MFKQGDIIPVNTLKIIDSYIKELHNTIGNTNNIVQLLYNTWMNIPTGDNANSIIDEINAIKEKQNSYINQ